MNRLVPSICMDAACTWHVSVQEREPGARWVAYEQLEPPSPVRRAARYLPSVVQHVIAEAQWQRQLRSLLREPLVHLQVPKVPVPILLASARARGDRVEERAEPHVRSSRGIRDVERDHHVAVRLAKAIRRQVHVVPAEHHGQSRRHEPLRERLRREVRQVNHGHPAAVQLRRLRCLPVAVQAIGLIEELGELLGVDTHHGIERVHLVVVRHACIVAPTKVRYPIAAAAHFAVSRRGVRPGDDVGVATRGG